MYNEIPVTYLAGTVVIIAFYLLFPIVSVNQWPRKIYPRPLDQDRLLFLHRTNLALQANGAIPISMRSCGGKMRLLLAIAT